LADKRFASIQFHSRHRAEISDAERVLSHRVYEEQTEDDHRWAIAMPGLLARLDLTAGAVVGMTCNDQFSVLLENWAASCSQSEIDCSSSTIVFATDIETHGRAEALGLVSYFDANSSFLQNVRRSGQYGDAAWTEYMFHQNWVIKNLLQAPVDVLFQDVDLVWRRDPRPHLIEQAREGADVQAMYDGPNTRFQPLYANSGFMYFRNSPQVRAFWAEVYARHEMVAYYRSQQEPLNILLAAHAHRGLDVRILEEERFANGHLYCGGRTAPTDPWVMHNSWTKDLAEKLRRYEENELWFL
jgi:hypothetical protein